jgi:hypothetical protein
MAPDVHHAEPQAAQGQQSPRRETAALVLRVSAVVAQVVSLLFDDATTKSNHQQRLWVTSPKAK